MSEADPATSPPDHFREFRREDIEQSIVQRFECVAAARPAATAVCALDRTLTYDQLNRAANRLAAVIRSRLGDGEEAVGLLLDQGADAVIAILGALKAGKFYLPLEPSHPAPRLSALLDDAGARLVVTDSAHGGLAVRLAGAERSVLRIDERSASSSEDDPRIPLAPDRLAYLFHTSGSTGQPKGVVDCHRNVLHNVMRYTNHLRISAADRLSLIQSPSFSGTVSSLFAALLNGGVICPFALRELGFGPLASWVHDRRITVYHSTPLIFRSMVAGASRFPAVRVVRLEGDQALPSDVALFRAHFEPESLLAIGLGATETGLSCQHRIDARSAIEAGVVPVGHATQDMSIVILDETGSDVGAGRTGEIGVRSRYLAVGYWRQPERTRAAFLPDPSTPGSRTYRTGDLGRLRADGVLEYLGRKDFQPRIRGQTVDVAEVEAALARIDGVREAAATVREEVPGEARLVACLVIGEARAPTIGQVRRALAPSLPEAMIPTELVLLDRLPRDGNGKLDRRALVAMTARKDVRRADATPARDVVEQALLAIWEAQFRRDDLSVDDDFFELGGDSLLAARIVLAIERATGTRLSPSILYEAPTIARLAAHVRGDALAALPVVPRAAGEPGNDILVPMQPHGSRPPLFLVHDHRGGLLCYSDLVRGLGSDQPCYGLRSPFEQSLARAPATLTELAALYREAIRSVQSRGPYRLCGVCFGGVLAFEIAQQLMARGEQVAFLGIVAVTPFDFPGLVTARAVRLFELHEGRERIVPRLRYYAARMSGLAWPEALRYLRGRSRLVMPLLRGRWQKLTLPPERAGTAPDRSALTELHDALFRGYEARPFPGSATLFLSEKSVAHYSSDPARDWQPLAAAGVDVRLMDVAGGAMLNEPHVELLARHMQELLRITHRAQAKLAGSRGHAHRPATSGDQATSCPPRPGRI